MRVTSQHWEVFLNICEKHPHFITGKFNGAQGKAEGNALWANVATKLNGLGLGEKSVVEWRRVSLIISTYTYRFALVKLLLS